jgi:flagellar protein FlgJ
MIGPMAGVLAGEHPGSVAGQADTDAEKNAARLREACEGLEGVFVQHLMKSLRSTVPNGGNPDAPGADLYGSLLDEHLAQTIAGDGTMGIADALYRQLTSLPRSSAGEGVEP